MLCTGVENVLNSSRRQPEYAIWGKGISLDDAKRISDIAQEHWQTARNALFQAISDAPEAVSGDTPHQVRVGFYVNYQPQTMANKSE
jgi:hypothetical protein